MDCIRCNIFTRLRAANTVGSDFIIGSHFGLDTCVRVVSSGRCIVTTEIYDKGFTHAMFVFAERICTVAIPSKFSCKVPNVFMTDQG